MNYLIDTNVISELRKRKQCNPNVAAWFAEMDDDNLFLSVLTIGELQRGVEKVRARDPKQAAMLNSWLHRITESFADKILPIDRTVAEEWGRLPDRDKIPVIDALIGSTALAHGMTVATRNLKDIVNTGALCLNPFDPR